MKFLRSYKYTLISILLFFFSLFLGSVGVSRFAVIATFIVFVLELYACKIERDFDRMCNKWIKESENTAEQRNEDET